MKPAQERNQECLPPKKRDLPVNNCSGAAGTAGAGLALGGGSTSGGSSGVGEDEVGSIQNSAANSDSQGGPPSGEWLRAQPGLHYGVDTSESIPAVPVDQYSMLYKVALPSVTYSPTSPHPVLSHISPAYTLHSPLLQHPGLPYPPLGYAQLPHSSLQFVSSPYAAVPYTLPPGFVPGSLISPSGALTQAHLVPYPSVIQEGVVSPPPQAQVAAHTFAKVSASSGVPLMLPSEQTTQQHLGTVGVLSAAELNSRGMPVFYHPQGSARATATTTTSSSSRDPHSNLLEKEREMNGRVKEQVAREVTPDHPGRNARLQQGVAISAAHESNQKRRLSSPGQRSTPDSDLEVQQVVGSLVSSSKSAVGGRKEVSFAPLNLSQNVQRVRDVHGETTSGRAAYVAQSVSYSDPRVTGLQQQQQQQQQQQPGQPAHAVMLANGQPVLIPVEYHPHHQPPAAQQHYSAQANDGSPKPSFKASDPSSRSCLPERALGEPAAAQPLQPAVQPPAEVTQALASSTVPVPASSNPSHFMKGAIIQLATGELKRVEDLQTQDFVRSAELSGGLKIDSSMVVDIRASQQRPGLVTLHFTVGEKQSKVTIDVPPEHPFFVFGQGWSSYSPERTTQLYGLACHQMQVGDVCVSITLQQQKAAQHHHPQQQNLSRTLSKTTTASEPSHQLMGPPAPQQSRPPQAHLRIERMHRDSTREADKDIGDKEEATHMGGVGHPEPPIRPSRTSGEHARSQSGYQLHTDASAFTGAAMGAMLGASHRRWSSPGLQRYNMKGETGTCPQISASGHIRPSFIPQEVKLSIEGRSNAGK
uniref:ataxin-1-like n=1 Tax=Doryrhamphus excisus TaxID=161450 RepID=UPI0025ADC08E|nr:ataxin-1-like [Doryrhamphus excisus]